MEEHKTLSNSNLVHTDTTLLQQNQYVVLYLGESSG